MIKIPYGIIGLLISCFDHHLKQFQGILKIAQILKAQQDLFFLGWDGNRLNLVRRRKLTRVLISGHGTESLPRFDGNSDKPFTPKELQLPVSAKLYLMGCFQGKDTFRKDWAKGTGISQNMVWGSDGETESALSTCLLLHLMEEGLDSIDCWFPEWIESNAYLRPYFPIARSLYRKHNQNPIHTLEELARIVDLTPVKEFLSVCWKYPQYLSDLLD